MSNNRVCAVPFCKSSGCCISTRTNKKISYHKFPSESKLKQQWLISIRRDENKYFQVKNHTVVCSEHFKEEDIEMYPFSKRSRLNVGSVPILFNCWENIRQPKNTMVHESEPNKIETQQRDSERELPEVLTEVLTEPRNTNYDGSLSANLAQSTSVQLPPTQSKDLSSTSCRNCVVHQEKIKKLERKCAKLLENCHAMKLENVQLKHAIEAVTNAKYVRMGNDV